jgi:hypothetical protein
MLGRAPLRHGLDSSPMAVWIRTVDRRDERVKTETDDASTIKAVINGTGWPYERGWVEIDGRQQQFIALAHVVSVEAREPTGGPE